MKRETIFKTVLILMIGAILFAIPINVNAEPTDIDSLFDLEDQGGLEDLQPEQETESDLDSTPETEPEPTPSTPKDETLPDAGLAEDTIMVVTIAGLVVLATVAYRKINEYQNI